MRRTAWQSGRADRFTARGARRLHQGASKLRAATSGVTGGNAFAEALEPRRMFDGGVDRLVNNNTGAQATADFTQSETSIVAWGANNVVVAYNDSGSNAT